MNIDNMEIDSLIINDAIIIWKLMEKMMNWKLFY